MRYTKLIFHIIWHAAGSTESAQKKNCKSESFNLNVWRKKLIEMNKFRIFRERDKNERKSPAHVTRAINKIERTNSSKPRKHSTHEIYSPRENRTRQRQRRNPCECSFDGLSSLQRGRPKFPRWQIHKKKPKNRWFKNPKIFHQKPINLAEQENFRTYRAPIKLLKCAPLDE